MSIPPERLADFLAVATGGSSTAAPAEPETPFQRARRAFRQFRSSFLGAEETIEGAGPAALEPPEAEYLRREPRALTPATTQDLLQVPRQAAETGIGIAEGTAQLALRGGPGGLIGRPIGEAIAEDAGLPEPRAIPGTEAVRDLADAERARVREFYGEPETPVGEVLGLGSRFAFEATPYFGGPLALTRIGRALGVVPKAARAVSRAPSALESFARGAAIGTPPDIAAGLRAPEETTLGAAAEFSDSEILRRAAEVPALAAGTEVGLGTLIGGPIDFLQGLSAARRAAAPARAPVREPSPHRGLRMIEQAQERARRRHGEPLRPIQPVQPARELRLAEPVAPYAEEFMPPRAPSEEVRPAEAVARVEVRPRPGEQIEFDGFDDIMATPHRAADAEYRVLPRREAPVRTFGELVDEGVVSREDLDLAAQARAFQERLLADRGGDTFQVPPSADWEQVKAGIADEYVNGRLLDERGRAVPAATRQERKLWFVTGPPGSGKSSVVVRRLVQDHGALELDADVVKERLIDAFRQREAIPDSNVRPAGIVHRDSAEIVEQRVLSAAVQRGDNIVMPKIGKTTADLEAWREALQDLGYEVGLILVDVDPTTSLTRALGRFRRGLEGPRGGRYVDPVYVWSGVGDEPRRVYDQLRAEGRYDAYEAWDNAVAQGEPGRLLDRFTRGEEPPVGEGLPGGGERLRAGAVEGGDQAPAPEPAGVEAEPVRIVSAAWRAGPDQPHVTGPTHAEARAKGGGDPFGLEGEDGFETSTGDFVDRFRGRDIAIEAGQVPGRPSLMQQATGLDSAEIGVPEAGGRVVPVPRGARIVRPLGAMAVREPVEPFAGGLAKDTTLYHVTTARSAVLEQGLRPPAERALAGEPLGPGLDLTTRALEPQEARDIYFTTRPEHAELLARQLRELAQVVRGDLTMDDMIAQAKAEGFMDSWMLEATGRFDYAEVRDPVRGRIPAAMQGEEVSDHWLQSWWTGRAPGQEDGFSWALLPRSGDRTSRSGIDAYRGLDESEVALLTYEVPAGTEARAGMDEIGEVVLENPRQAKLLAVAEERIAFGGAEKRASKPLARGAIEEDEIAHGSVQQAEAAAARVATYPSASRVPPTFDERLRRVRMASRVWVDIRRLQANKPELVASLLRPFRDPLVEKFHVLYLDAEGRVLAHNFMGSGDLTSVAFDMDDLTRTVADRARRLEAASVRLAHNHPTGLAEPSGSDMQFTRAFAGRLYREGITLDGHTVIDGDHAYEIIPSVYEDGLITSQSFYAPGEASARAERVSVPQKQMELLPDWTQVEDVTARYPWQVAELARRVDAPDGFQAIYLDPHGRVLAIEPHRASAVKTVGEWTTARAKAIGALRVALAAEGDTYDALVAAVRTAQENGQAGQVADVVNPITRRSAHGAGLVLELPPSPRTATGLAEEGRPYGGEGGLKPTEEETAMRALADEEPSNEYPYRGALSGTPGRDTIVTTADGTKVAVHYRVVEADELMQSHDPFTFEPVRDYPERVQERDYQREPGAAAHVEMIERRFDPSRVLDPTRSPIEGPPIARYDGVVLGGNGRTMAIKRVYVQRPESAAAYKAAIAADARDFGLDPDAIQEMTAPVLVRVVDDQSKDWTSIDVMADLGSKLNDDPAKARGAVADAYTRSQRMRVAAGALQHFTETFDAELDRTIRRYLDTAAGEEFATRLSHEGVIRPEEVNEFYVRDEAGNLKLSPAGKDRIEELMELAAVGDQQAVRDAPASWRAKLTHAYPALIQASRIEGFDLGPMLREALRIGSAARAAEMDVGTFLQQIDLFGREPERIPADLARFLEEAKPTDVSVLSMAALLDEASQARIKEAFRQFAMEAEVAATGRQMAGDLFGADPPTPEEAFTRRFGIEMPEGGLEWLKGAARRLRQRKADPLEGLTGPAREKRERALEVLDEAEGVLGTRPATPAGPPEGPPEVPGGKAPSGPEDRFPEGGRLFNFARFDLDPTGRETLRRVEQDLLDSGRATRTVVPWERVRAQANRLGLDAEDVIERAQYQREPLTDAQMLATADLLADYADRHTRISAYLHQNRASLSEAETETLERALSVMETRMEVVMPRYGAESSQRGRSLNAMKIMANRNIDNVAAWYEMARRMLGPDAPRADWSEIRARINEHVRNRDKKALIAYLGSLRHASNWEKLATARKAGLLFGLKSHGKNFLSNTSFAGMVFARQPVAYVLDQLARLSVNLVSMAGGHGAVGVRTKAGLGLRMMDAARDGAIRGVREAGEMMRSDVALDDALLKRDIHRRVNYKTRWLDFYVNKTLASYGAADRPHRQLGFAFALRDQAEVMAANEGLTGRLKKQRADELYQNPTPEMMAYAEAHAAWAVFQNRGVLGEAILGLKARVRHRTEAGGFAVEQVFPFTMTPANVATRVAEFSPLGLMRPQNVEDVLTIYRAALQGAPAVEAQRRLVENVANVLVGTTTAIGAMGAFAMLSGYSLASQGRMTGAYPEDARTRAAWRLEGKHENAVLVGGKWRSVEGLSPLGNLMALGANLWEAQQDPEVSEFGAAAGALASIGTTVTEQSFLRGAQEVLDVLDDPRAQAEKFVASQITSFVPTIVRQSAGIGVETERERRVEPEVLPEFTGSVEGRIRGALPGLQGTLPEAVSVLGEPIERDPSVVANIADPLYSRVASDDPVVLELQRVGAGIPDLKKRPGESTDAFLARRRLYGQRAKGVIGRVMASPEYQSIPDRARAAVQARPELRGVDPDFLARFLQREMIQDAADQARSRLTRRINEAMEGAQ